MLHYRHWPHRGGPSRAGRPLLAGVLALVLALNGSAAVQAAVAESAAAGEATVKLNFPQEIPIQALVDYVSERLRINILYDQQQLTQKKINVKAATEIPVSSLLGVLESALKTTGFALVEAEAPDWKKIVQSDQLVKVAADGDAAEAIKAFGKGTAVTQAFVLKNADVQQVGQLIEPFLTKPGSNVISLAQSHTLIVTDYATNVLKIAKWIEYIDQPKAAAATEFVPVENVDLAGLATQITTVLAAKARLKGAAAATPEVELVPDQTTGQLLLIGPPESVQETRELVRSLDKPLGLITKTYQFVNVKASAIDKLVTEMVAPSADSRLYRSVVEEEENLLIVKAPQEIHRQIEELRKARDVPVQPPESPVRFYKVKNLPVMELLETIRSMESEARAGSSARAAWRQLPTDGRIRPARERPVPGPNLLPAPTGSTELPSPPAVKTPQPKEASPAQPKEASPAQRSEAAYPSPEIGEVLGRARVTADIHTNTLIVVAEPSVHRVYEDLIKQLDLRRPQVMIEAKFVVVDTSDDFSLGVEVSGGDRQGAKRLFAFTSYGLSTVNPVSGALSIIPGLGFNGTLVDPDTADAVVRALTKHSRARVMSAPRVLVNDNATGQLTSVAEVPFTSVNASQTVATTSFAGFADAGTTITVTPRIRDEHSLQLDFAITVNTFTGTGSGGVPPPRQTEEITSEITIPDGHTVIVGGLNQGSHTRQYTGFPVLERIPIVRGVSGLTTDSRSKSSMFVFLRPIILQEDKFRDLKFISQKDSRAACLRPEYPASAPVWMH